MPLSAPAAPASHGDVDALNQRAQALRLSDARAALALARQAQALALQLDYQQGLAWALLRVSVCRIILGDVDQPGGPPELAQALSLVRSLGDLSGEAEALNLQGNLLLADQQHEQAQACYERSLAIHQAAGDVVGENRVLHNLALVLQDMGRLPEALAANHRCLALARQRHSVLDEAYALLNLGKLLSAVGEQDEALQHLQRALVTARSTDDHALQSTVLFNLGRLLTQAGAHPQALDHLRVAFDLAQGAGNAEDLARALLGLGQLHQAMQDHAVAAPLLDEALQLARRRADRVLVTEVLLAQAATPMAQGQPAHAVQLLGDALQQLHDGGGGSPLLAGVHQRLSQAHEALGDLAEALRHFKAFHATLQLVHNQAALSQVRALLTEQAVAQARQVEQARSAQLSQALDEARRSAQTTEQLLAELQAQAQMLQQLAREDGLTGVANRRWLDLQLQRELERARRFGHPLTVVMVDIDHFKSVNDQHSHAVGDAVLRQVARLLRDGCRSSDVVGRYGGEEFALLLVETAPAQARVLADKLRQRIADHPWAEVHAALGPVTASLGLAGFDDGWQAADGADAPDGPALLALADAQLYAAKHAGRNRVCG